MTARTMSRCSTALLTAAALEVKHGVGFWGFRASGLRALGLDSGFRVGIWDDVGFRVVGVVGF